MGSETDRETTVNRRKPSPWPQRSGCIGETHSERTIQKCPSTTYCGIPGSRDWGHCAPRREHWQREGTASGPRRQAGQAAPLRGCATDEPPRRAPGTHRKHANPFTIRAGSRHRDDPRHAFTEDGFLPPPTACDTLRSALCAFREGN